MNKYVISALVNNHPGVLSRVSGLFTRRGYNITSLSVGETSDSKVSRMTIVVSGDEYIVSQIMKQLKKLIDVYKLELLDNENSVYRELMLVKICTTPQTRPEILETVNIFRGHIVDVGPASITVEITGDQNKLQAFVKICEEYKIKELVRTGVTALQRGNKELKD